MNKLKIKIITGFRKDQEYTIDAEEAHKAYYLFQNPDKRGIFNNGLAIIGKDIRAIEPDYHATMGWNPSHELDSDDWNELNAKNIPRDLRDLMYKAKQLSNKPELISTPLSKTKLLEEKLNK